MSVSFVPIMMDGLIQKVREGFKLIKDHRKHNVTHSLSDLLSAAFAIFSLKDPSLLAFREQFPYRSANLKRVYGIEKIPGDTALREGLDGVLPSSLQAQFEPLMRWYDASVGRWWSVDLMAEKTSFNNPYYVSNNPIIRVDPTGMFGVTYGAAGYSSTSAYFEGSQQKQDELQQDKPKAVVNILSLPGANQTVVKQAKKDLDGYLKLAGIDVKTKVVTQTSKFDIKKIKPRDAVAVVGGSNAEAADYILNKIDRGYYSKKYKDQLEGDGFRDKDKYNNIEKSDKGDTGWGYLIATSTDIQLDVWKFKSQSNAVAFSILHGMGHNAGFSHLNENDPDRGFMNGGGTLMGAISVSTPEQMIKGTPMIVINQIQQRFHY